MHKTTLSAWCSSMQDSTTPTDELAIFALSKLYHRNSVAYTKSKTWSTIRTSAPKSEKEVYMQCELKFVLMGKNNFMQLIKKPSVSMPVIPFELMESVYESGYFVDMDQNKHEDTEPIPLDTPQTTTTTTDPESPKEQDETQQYCAIHGCNVMDENTNIPKSAEKGFHQNIKIVSFPKAAKVCATSKDSSLQDFNPLNDSEPNLEFDMTC